MEISWIVTLPPLLVLVIAFTTRNVIASLASGIISAAFIASNYSLIGTTQLIAVRLLQESRLADLFQRNGNYDHAYTFGFLIALGILIELMTQSGGIRAYTERITRYLPTKKTTETTSLLLSLSLFIDDYLNSLTVGAIMRPLTDKFAIPRAKLAFLLGSMSGPLCLLVPATSWVAFILMQLQASGISLNAADQPVVSADPFTVYIEVIPYLLYPIFITASAWFIVRNHISFGMQYKQEQIATKTGNLFGGKTPLHQSQPVNNNSGSIADFIIPLLVFLMGIPSFALLQAGWRPFAGILTWYQALQNADLILSSLFFASCTALGIAVFRGIWQRTLTLKQFNNFVIAGFMLMKNSLIVLLLAWTLSALLKNDLQTGSYLAHSLITVMPLAFFPCACLLASFIISASTGSVWGTISIMLPLSIPLLASATGAPLPIMVSLAPLLLPTLGAILSGAVAGSHFSPITDASVMAASSAGAYHLDYVQIQMLNSLPALLSTVLCFILFSAIPSSLLYKSFVIFGGIAATCLLLVLFNKNK